jgi:hypothetical protein
MTFLSYDNNTLIHILPHLRPGDTYHTNPVYLPYTSRSCGTYTCPEADRGEVTDMPEHPSMYTENR